MDLVTKLLISVAILSVALIIAGIFIVVLLNKLDRLSNQLKFYNQSTKCLDE